MPDVTEFQLTEVHINLLQELYIDEGQYGIPEIGQKRPFGNSDILGDVAEYLGIEKVETENDEDWPKGTYDKCKEVLSGLYIALQICLITQSFEPGLYRLKDKYDRRSWVLVPPKKSIR